MEVKDILNSSVVVALIALIGTIVKMYYNNRTLKKEKSKVERDNYDLKTKLADLSLNLELDIVAAQELENIVRDIFKTKVDRFLILSSTNGTEPMKYATVLLERHKDNEYIKWSIGATDKYIRFEFDPEYRELLNMTEQFGMVKCDLKNMKSGDYYNIMKDEKLSYSNWYFLKRRKVNDTRDIMFYTSMATHSKEPFTEVEEMKLKLAAGKLQEWVKQIDNRNQDLAK